MKINRRRFCLYSTALLSLPTRWAGAAASCRIGIVTDPHYADVDTRGTRHYRDSLEKMIECVDELNAQGAEFLVEIGDLKDQDDKPDEKATLAYLTRIETMLAKFQGPRYHVLGNHDMDSLSKEQFMSRIENSGIEGARTYYSFDRNGMHFIILDATFNGDGTPYDRGNFKWTDANIPTEELNWLREDLQSSDSPAIVFVHQLLDGEGDVYINNAAEVREILEESGKTLAVFQGHHHPGQYNRINGIHYYTLKGMVEGAGRENNSFAIVEINPDKIIVKGYKRAVSAEWA
ncbi:MAG: hypothetical protein GC154_17835 [bacterium]|nr:hypothetical protein [bacterium]